MQSVPLLQCVVTLQIKRWAASTPGWAITSLFMTASKFDSAPTGSSTMMRFLKPKGSPESTAQGPAVRAAAAFVGQTSAAQEVSGVTAAAAAETHDSLAATVPKAAEAARSLSEGLAHHSAGPEEAAVHTLEEGLPIEHRSGASTWRGSSSKQLAGSICPGVEDAASRTPQPSHDMSIAHRHDCHQHLLEEASRADPADQLPDSSRQPQETLQQALQQSRPVNVVDRACAANEVLHSSDIMAQRGGLAHSAHTGEGDSALQHEQASDHIQPAHRVAANAEIHRGGSRELPSSEPLDSYVARERDDEDSRSCQKGIDAVEVPAENARESRQQSLGEGTHGGGTSTFTHPSHQVQSSFQHLDM